MSLVWVQYDTDKKCIVKALSLPGAPIEEHFTVTADAGQTEFVTTTPFTAVSKLTVFVNGIKNREGSLPYQYTRNHTLSKIVFNTAQPKNAWISVEVY